ncbi:MAG: MCE family protein [Deltaproteobacteria bacterium]|nr:MCE family protein [Candidatus Tharpella sp.]
MQKTVLKKKKGISPIWILPIVALMIGGWLIYTSYRDAGINIVVHFPNAEGITTGKTKVVYKGITIGVVRDIEISPDISNVALHLEMDRKVKAGLVEDTKFWIVKPEVSAGRISGLGTLLSGSYIDVQRGVSKVECREFTALSEVPPVQLDAPGLHIKLTAGNLGSIQRNTQIYHKNIPIGSVQGYTLDEAHNRVVIDAFIEPNYQHLIKTKTRFWNSSGINFKGGLSGFKFRMESLATLVYGGISLYTPKYQSLSPVAKNGRVFQLYDEFDDAQFGLKMTLQLSSASGIEAEITKVMYRGFKAGVVTEVDFDEDKKTITAHINIDPQAEFILREGTRFWVVEPQVSINDVRNLDTLLKGSYIAFEPGDGIYLDYFVAEEAPKAKKIIRPGKYFSLLAENSSSFSIAAPVIYRKLQVGEITDFELEPDGKKVRAEIFIEEKYSHLIKNTTIFWKAGGLKIDASLDGIKIESETLTTMLAGGISFTNPDPQKSPNATEHQIFKVHGSFQDAIKCSPVLQDHGITVQLQAASAKSFTIGSPILYKHIEVGTVTDIILEENGQNLLLDIFIKNKYAHLLQTSSLFYNISGITVEGGLSGIRLETGSLKSIIAGGIAFFTPETGPQASKGEQYILYDNHQDALDIDKTLISLTFTKPHGLKEGVAINYQGITIGNVREVTFNAAMDAVICSTLIEKKAAKLFTSDTKIWLVSPEVSLAGVNNLETIISGSYITLIPGPGAPTTTLSALDAPPALDKVDNGLNIILETRHLGSLNKNSPLYFRQVEIGRVTGSRLSPMAQKVWVHVNIKSPYDRLIRNNSKFWNSSGINVKAGLFSGVKITTESLETIMIGGLSLATPEGEEMGSKVANGHHFILHDELNECWLEWQPQISLD